MRQSRRTFLVASGALALSGCGGVMRLSGIVDDDRVTLPRADIEPMWERREPVVVALGPDSGAVILWPLDGGDARALGATCTHLGCGVRPSGEFLRCPCHGSTFGSDGRVVRGPAQRPLPVYPVHITDHTVEIRLTQARSPQ